MNRKRRCGVQCRKERGAKVARQSHASCGPDDELSTAEQQSRTTGEIDVSSKPTVITHSLDRCRLVTNHEPNETHRPQLIIQGLDAAEPSGENPSESRVFCEQEPSRETSNKQPLYTTDIQMKVGIKTSMHGEITDEKEETPAILNSNQHKASSQVDLVVAVNYQPSKDTLEDNTHVAVVEAAIRNSAESLVPVNTEKIQIPSTPLEAPDCSTDAPIDSQHPSTPKPKLTKRRLRFSRIPGEGIELDPENVGILVRERGKLVRYSLEEYYKGVWEIAIEADKRNVHNLLVENPCYDRHFNQPRRRVLQRRRHAELANAVDGETRPVKRMRMKRLVKKELVTVDRGRPLANQLGQMVCLQKADDVQVANRQSLAVTGSVTRQPPVSSTMRSGSDFTVLLAIPRWLMDGRPCRDCQKHSAAPDSSATMLRLVSWWTSTMVDCLYRHRGLPSLLAHPELIDEHVAIVHTRWNVALVEKSQDSDGGMEIDKCFYPDYTDFHMESVTKMLTWLADQMDEQQQRKRRYLNSHYCPVCLRGRRDKSALVRRADFLDKKNLVQAEINSPQLNAEDGRLNVVIVLQPDTTPSQLFRYQCSKAERPVSHKKEAGVLSPMHDTVYLTSYPLFTNPPAASVFPRQLSSYDAIRLASLTHYLKSTSFDEDIAKLTPVPYADAVRENAERDVDPTECEETLKYLGKFECDVKADQGFVQKNLHDLCGIRKEWKSSDGFVFEPFTCTSSYTSKQESVYTLVLLDRVKSRLINPFRVKPCFLLRAMCTSTISTQRALAQNDVVLLAILHDNHGNNYGVFMLQKLKLNWMAGFTFAINCPSIFTDVRRLNGSQFKFDANLPKRYAETLATVTRRSRRYLTKYMQCALDMEPSRSNPDTTEVNPEKPVDMEQLVAVITQRHEVSMRMPFTFSKPIASPLPICNFVWNKRNFATRRETLTTLATCDGIDGTEAHVVRVYNHFLMLSMRDKVVAFTGLATMVPTVVKMKEKLTQDSSESATNQDPVTDFVSTMLWKKNLYFETLKKNRRLNMSILHGVLFQLHYAVLLWTYRLEHGYIVSNDMGALISTTFRWAVMNLNHFCPAFFTHSDLMNRLRYLAPVEVTDMWKTCLKYSNWPFFDNPTVRSLEIAPQIGKCRSLRMHSQIRNLVDDHALMRFGTSTRVNMWNYKTELLTNATGNSEKKGIENTSKETLISKPVMERRHNNVKFYQRVVCTSGWMKSHRQGLESNEAN